MAYTPGIPNSTDVISQSQSQIRTNFFELNSQFSIDHISFDAGSNNGKHKKVSFEGNNVPAAPTGFESVLYTNAGTADNTSSELFWVNKNSTFHFPVKAWAFCNGSSGGIVSSQSFNVTSVTRSSTGTYNVVIPSGVLASSNYSVIVTCSNKATFPTSDAILGFLRTESGPPTSTTFTIRTVNVSQSPVVASDPASFSFMVLQI